MIEKGKPVNILYLDFAKAFNTVPPKKLHTLKAHGIDGKVLNWIEAFLVGCQQRVSVGDRLSGWMPVPSEVPQGSVLAPLLVLAMLCINGLPSFLKCGIKIFADYYYSDYGYSYHSVRQPQDAATLREDLDATVHWVKEWQLTFDAAKHKVLHISSQDFHHVYALEGKQWKR